VGLAEHRGDEGVDRSADVEADQDGHSPRLRRIAVQLERSRESAELGTRGAVVEEGADGGPGFHP
jgi:hypothetical protein